MRSISPLIAAVLLALSLTAGAVSGAAGQPGAHTWEMQRDRDNIQIYTRRIEGSKYRAVRGVMVVPASLSKLTALVQDMEACPEWVSLCKKAHIHKAVSDREFYVYSYNDVPWPVSDRDVVAHVRWRQNPDTLAVTMNSVAVPGMVPPEPGAVRIEEATTHWVFTPKTEGLVEVVTEAHIDPGGPMPAWLMDRLLVDSPFKTLSNMREILRSEKYRNARFDFISEPSEKLLGHTDGRR